MISKEQHRRNAAALRKAIEILDKDGWRAGRMGARGEAHCVLGAIRLADGAGRYRSESTVYENSPAAQAFGQCLVLDRKIVSADAFHVYGWNDRQGVGGKARVVRALDKCAESEDEKGR